MKRILQWIVLCVFVCVLSRLIAEIQERCAQKGVIPIKDDDSLMLRGLLRLSTFHEFEKFDSDWDFPPKLQLSCAPSAPRPANMQACVGSWPENHPYLKVERASAVSIKMLNRSLSTKLWRSRVFISKSPLECQLFQNCSKFQTPRPRRDWMLVQNLSRRWKWALGVELHLPPLPDARVDQVPIKSGTSGWHFCRGAYKRGVFCHFLHLCSFGWRVEGCIAPVKQPGNHS